MLKNCVYCGSADLEYIGIEDCGGRYGDMLCDMYECRECGELIEYHCIEVTLPQAEDYDE